MILDELMMMLFFHDEWILILKRKHVALTIEAVSETRKPVFTAFANTYNK